jgi:RsiW-degrading membrane proteinase PrsW (M82 family)
MSISTFILYFVIGALPAIVWLLFYLRQDVHPESNKKIIEIFLWGGIMVVPVCLAETILECFFPEKDILLQNTILLFIYYIFVVGVVEEFFKYWVVKKRVINSSHLDEPIDLMLYLIISGLGFAMVENLSVILSSAALEEAIFVSLIRLLTAVFLHSLTAAITGYFLAVSLYNRKKIFIAVGILIAATFHGLYNLSIIELNSAENLFSFLLPIVIIFLMAIIVYIFFKKVKCLPRGSKI